MYSKISVLVPTRKRTARLREMVLSFIRTTSGRAELVFRIDSDDHESWEYFQSWDCPWRVFVGPRHDGYRSTPQFLIDMLTVATGDVVMVGNDDMVFVSPGWDGSILEEANKHPEGLFNIGVETMNATHFPFSCVARSMVDKLGFVYDPRLFWGDIYLRDIAAAFNGTVLLPNVHITHDWAGNNPDGTFYEANNFKLTVGTPEYWQRHAELVREAVVKLSGVAA